MRRLWEGDRCGKCGRPSRCYGGKDQETGWEGWCHVCNWHWRFGAAHLHRMLDKIISSPVAVRLIMQFQMSAEAIRVLSDIEQHGLQARWRRIVNLRGPPTYYVAHSLHIHERVIKEVGEEEDGMIDPYRDYVNIMWKLQLMGRGRWTPFDIVVEMLGSPTLYHSNRTYPERHFM